MSVLIFLAVLFVLVLVHELGHFVVAKLTKMRVDEFGIGFPPRIFGIKKGETTYALNLLPIGGYVKILGENSEAGESGSEESFTAKSKWAQSAVLLAGVTMNVLLAWVLFAAVLTMGVQTAVSEADASPEAVLIVTGTLPEGPAAEAGVPSAAEIVSLRTESDALTELTPSAFRSFVETHDAEALFLTYRKGNEESEVTLTPTAGLVAESPEDAIIGVGLTLTEVVRTPFFNALYESALLTATTLKDITFGISKLLYDAVRFDADLSEVAGPVGIVGLVDEASAFGITALLMFTAFISLNLAVINLLPFPALDGGRLLFVLIEAIKGSPIRSSWVAGLNTFGFALLILLMIAVTFNDVARLI